MDVAEAQVDHQKMYMDILEERRRYGEMEISKIILMVLLMEVPPL